MISQIVVLTFELDTTLITLANCRYINQQVYYFDSWKTEKIKIV